MLDEQIEITPDVIAALPPENRQRALQIAAKMKWRREYEQVRYFEPVTRNIRYNGVEYSQVKIWEYLNEHPDLHGLVVTGGNQAGKDKFFKSLICMTLDGQGPFANRWKPPLSVRCVVLDFDAGYEALVNNENSGFKSIIRRDLLVDRDWSKAETRRSSGTSRVRLAGRQAGGLIEIMSDRQDPAIHGGPARNIWYSNELPKNKKIFDEGMRRLAKTNGLCLLVGTAVRGSLHWVRQIIEEIKRGERENWVYFQLDARNNPEIDQQRLADDMRYMSEAEKIVRVFGGIAPEGERLFPRFSRKNSVLEPFNPSNELVQAVILDSHRKKDNYFLNVAFEPIRDRVFLHILRESTCTGGPEETNKLSQIRTQGKAIKYWMIERATETTRKGDQDSEWSLYTDPNISKYANPRWEKWDADAPGRKALLERFIEPIPINEEYVSEITGQRYFCQLLIHECCPETIEQIENASWKPDVRDDADYSERRVKLYDDFLDCGMVAAQLGQIEQNLLQKKDVWDVEQAELRYVRSASGR